MKTYSTIIISLLIALSTYAQEKVYFPFFEIMNIHYEYQYSASRLFKTYVENNNKYTIMLPDKPDSIYRTESFSQTQAKAKSLSAPYFIVAELNALNNVMIISMALYNTEDGHKVWSDMLKARTPDDLDPVLLRLAKALGTSTKAAEAGDIYSVSDYESKELGKIEANYNFGIYVGGINTFFPGLDNNFSGGFGIMFSYDSRDIILDINGQAYFGNAAFYNFNLSTLYPFSKGKNSPYVGAGLGYGGNSIKVDVQGTDYFGTPYTFKETHSNGGLIFFLHGGYIINRTSSVHIQPGLSAFIPMYKIDSKMPAGIMFNLVFLF